MKVLHIVPFLSSRAGGVTAFATESAVALATVGVESKLFATNLGDVPGSGSTRLIEPSEYPADADSLDFELFPVRAPHRLAYSPTMSKRLSETVNEFDVVHVHSLWLYPQFAGQRAARKHDVPFVVSPHGSLDPYLRNKGAGRKQATNLLWQNGMFKHADLFHVTTADEQGFISDIAPTVPRWIAPCGVWADRLAAPGDGEKFLEQSLGGDARPVIMFLGRISDKKGVDILIKSFALFVRDGGDANLAIVGPDDEDLVPGLRTLASGLGVADRVHFVGPLYGADRADALAAATVWALTSHTENFGIAVVEASAAGLPAIVSRGVSIAADMDRSGAALMVELDARAAADAMASLIGDAQLRSEMSVKAKEYAVKFDWNVVAPELKAMYESVVS